METLKFLLQSKHADIARSHEVVSEAVEWMNIQLRNAGIASQYTERGGALGHFGHFQIESSLKKTPLTLHIKIAEINGVPYASAEVRSPSDGVLFPYFGDIGTQESKTNLLHFVADFYLSTTPKLAEN